MPMGRVFLPVVFKVRVAVQLFIIFKWLEKLQNNLAFQGHLFLLCQDLKSGVGSVASCAAWELMAFSL